ncbi:MAG: hypothetical protein NXY57DRAFT_1037459 [Lentinula lateritia]|nr:MAG: hypothetical protein NXY57DRAFT_1037459 [Lentinula lateritia]
MTDVRIIAFADAVRRWVEEVWDVVKDENEKTPLIDAFKKELRLCRDTKLVDGLSEDGNLILQFDKKAEAWRTIANLFVIGELLQREGDHCFPSFAGSQMAGFNQQVFKKLWKAFEGKKGWPGMVEIAINSWQKAKAPAREGSCREAGMSSKVYKVLGVGRGFMEERHRGIISNLNLAAWYISLCREGHTNFPLDFAQLSQWTGGIDVELAEEYKGTKWELSGHLALLISPIGLLQTRGIRHLSLHRGVLLQARHHLAQRERPASLIAVEDFLWEGILKMSRAEINGDQLLEELARFEGWKHVSEQDMFFFNLDERVEAMPPLANVSAGSLDAPHITTTSERNETNNTEGSEDVNIGPGRRADREEVEQMLFAIDAELSLISAQSTAIKSDSTVGEEADKSGQTRVELNTGSPEISSGDEGRGSPTERRSKGAPSESEDMGNPPRGTKRRSTDFEDDTDDEGQDLHPERRSTEAQSESEDVDDPPRRTRQRSTDVEDDPEDVRGRSTDDEDESDELRKVGPKESEQGADDAKGDEELGRTTGLGRGGDSSDCERNPKRRKITDQVRSSEERRSQDSTDIVSAGSDIIRVKKEEQARTERFFETLEEQGPAFEVSSPKELFYKKECLLFDHSGEIGLKTVIRSQLQLKNGLISDVDVKGLEDAKVNTPTRTAGKKILEGPDRVVYVEEKIWAKWTKSHRHSVMRNAGVCVRSGGNKATSFDQVHAEQALGDLDMPRWVNDWGLIQADDNRHLEDQIRVKGSLRNVLRSAKRGNKILDSTRINIHMANPKSFGLGTDEEAILFVRNLENLRFVALGLGGGEWGRVATANVIQQWHVEDAGKASMLQLCRGLGCLVFARPKIGIDREGFLRVGFEEAEDEGWDYYSVILESGDCWWVKQPMRFMGPLVPHLLFTLEPSLLKGSQFLFAWTMKESCYGLLDAFVARRGITDAVYHDTLHVMVCVLIFWSEKMDKTFHAGGYQKNSHHLNPGKMEDLITILMVTNVVQLARVLDTRTYEGGMPSSIARAYGVGDAYVKRLLHWLEGNVWVTHSADKSQSNFVVDFAHEFLVLQAKALIIRRWMLQQRDIAGNVTQESAREVRRAIEEENFARENWFKRYWPSEEQWDELLSGNKDITVDFAWDKSPKGFTYYIRNAA